jgi:RIO kinase 1
MILFGYLSNQVIGDFVGLVSAGKEANVYLAAEPNGRLVAIKIYKISLGSARWMRKYIVGDPRFRRIGRSPKNIIHAWAKKEHKNLKLIARIGLPCPRPLKVRDNVLMMTYVGNAEGTPAPRLHDAVLPENPVDLTEMYQEAITFVDVMFNRGHLVHGDLSEYNLLWHEGRQIIIDVSQAVSRWHPQGLPFLFRDIVNLTHFYNSRGVEVEDPRTIYYQIVRDQRPFGGVSIAPFSTGGGDPTLEEHDPDPEDILIVSSEPETQADPAIPPSTTTTPSFEFSADGDDARPPVLVRGSLRDLIRLETRDNPGEAPRTATEQSSSAPSTLEDYFPEGWSAESVDAENQDDFFEGEDDSEDDEGPLTDLLGDNE